jgi:hypothetical protein
MRNVPGGRFTHRQILRLSASFTVRRNGGGRSRGDGKDGVVGTEVGPVKGALTDEMGRSVAKRRAISSG